MGTVVHALFGMYGRWGLLLEDGTVRNLGSCTYGEALAEQRRSRIARRQAIRENEPLPPLTLGVVQFKRQWTTERREKMAKIHRKRWGAPDGYCTIYGRHVLLEHAEPIRFWAQWLAAQYGKESAADFVAGLIEEDYASVDRIRDMWLERQQVAENREMIREIEVEVFRAAGN